MKSLLVWLGSPLWLPLLIAAAAVVLSLYVALWAVFASLVGCAFGGVAGGILLLVMGRAPSGLFLIAAGLVCGGASIFLFHGCRLATIGCVKCAKAAGAAVKSSFTGKGEAQ